MKCSVQVAYSLFKIGVDKMTNTVAPMCNQMKTYRGRECKILGTLCLGKVKGKVVPVLN
jgi:hypothetical protein